MPCPFRVVIIVISGILALAAAILAVTQSTEVDEEGNERPMRSVKDKMGAWYDRSVRPWIPLSWGGVKRVRDEDMDAGEAKED